MHTDIQSDSITRTPSHILITKYTNTESLIVTYTQTQAHTHHHTNGLSHRLSHLYNSLTLVYSEKHSVLNHSVAVRHTHTFTRTNSVT